MRPRGGGEESKNRRSSCHSSIAGRFGTRSSPPTRADDTSAAEGEPRESTKFKQARSCRASVPFIRSRPQAPGDLVHAAGRINVARAPPPPLMREGDSPHEPPKAHHREKRGAWESRPVRRQPVAMESRRRAAPHFPLTALPLWHRKPTLRPFTCSCTCHVTYVVAIF